ncbi:hypothetical protein GCM10009836_38830 [Pseudonocardia ailaonensis]|uniref:Amino acid adenylation domain-containing protein n=1 Tax=Pseudonocardia ailaonensis TaxID=367279 RepID=A0ABN2N6D9_9PSEU
MLSAPRAAPHPRTLPALFAAALARDPGATAVVSGPDRLTYAELDARADRLARRLVAAGAGPERIVGVAVGRTVELVVAVLGVVRSGAAYLPLDRAYPAARTAFMLADASPVAIVVDGAGAPAGAGDITPVPVAGETADAALPGADAGQPGADGVLPAIDPDTTAYVIYTSGSTGVPKGVLVPHASAAALFAATARVYAAGPGDVWACCHSASFDFSVWEIWGPLVTGGATLVVPTELTWSPADLLGALAAHGVTVLSQTPSSFDRLMRAEADREAAGEPPLPVRTVVFGGEALDPARLHGRLATLPRLVNMYGITETTVHVTHADTAPGSPATIGEPLAGLSVSLRDDRLAAAEAGEMYVAGPQLARGYGGRPGLTATRFVAAPGGTRAYRSGDLAVRRDGALTFAGRADAQVTLRGFRIELGEVEAAVATHPLVAACAVAVSGDQRLVAHVVAGPLAERELAAVRAHAAERLPAHMVPALVVPIAELPLTPNGKLDRAALPAPPPVPGTTTRPDRRALLRRRLAGTARGDR